MADKESLKARETNIAVLSVLKKGSFLKRIFLNLPPPPPLTTGDDFDPTVRGGGLEADYDRPVLFGRHPDCHIVLDHPSISRFHLAVHLVPSMQNLSVTDLSSVHGTWVSGTKIPPNVVVDMVDGDTLRLGASTRVYRLQWVSPSRALEMENPLEPLVEGKEETNQDDSGESITDTNDLWPTVIPSAPPLPEFVEPPPLPPEEQQQSPVRKVLETESLNLFSAAPAPMLESVETSMPTVAENSTPVLSAAKQPSEREHLSPERSAKGSMPSSLLSRRSKSKSIGFLRLDTGKGKEEVGNARPNTEIEEGIGKENGNACDHAKREDKLCRVLFDNVRGKEKDREEYFDSDKENVTPMSGCHKIKRSCRVLQQSVCVAEHQNVKENMILSESKENWSENPTFESLAKSGKGEGTCGSDHDNWKSSSSVVNCQKELQMSHASSITVSSVLEYVNHVDKENWTPDCKKDKSRVMSEIPVKVEVNEVNVTVSVNRENWPTKPTFEILAKSKKEEGTCGSVQENLRSSSSVVKSNKCQKEMQMHSSTITNSSVLEDVNYVDKENWTPDSSKGKSRTVLSGIPVEVKDSEDAFTPNKENLTPEVSRSLKSKIFSSSTCARIEKEIMKKRVERIPFQPLLENSPSRSNNAASIKHDMSIKLAPNRSSMQPMGEVLHKAEERKVWNIVVDANCFLDEESRRSLQLLEGLKGTHLIVPQLVIRELDCLKRRESIFNKSTKMASKALQWIEECMVKISWWIHVQSSSETLPVAPTPAVSPRSPFGDGTDHKSFSTYGSLTEIVSPTAEDHILDSALLFKKIKNDGQLVLLSNSITLKIKAMAEGLRCEAPKEFRESLVNPFSKRFLWANSSPRGSTWSCTNDMGLFDNYLQHQPARRVGKAAEATKGLKLILLHNSQYAQINSVK